MQSASLSTPATAGLIEYDGKVLYSTPQATQRGVVPGMQYYALSSGFVGANTTAVQNVFNVSCTVSSNTIYEFEFAIALAKTVGTASHTVAFGFGGSATLNFISYMMTTQYNTANFANGIPAFFYSNVATSTVWTSAITTAAMTNVLTGRGSVSINAGGTFTPQYTLSATGGPYTTRPGSYFLIYPIGAAGANISVGTWA
jgi:hypothetical protein